MALRRVYGLFSSTLTTALVVLIAEQLFVRLRFGVGYSCGLWAKGSRILRAQLSRSASQNLSAVVATVWEVLDYGLEHIFICICALLVPTFIIR